MTSRPPTLSCSISGGGGCPRAAGTKMGAKRPHSGPPPHCKLLNQRRRWLPERGGHDDGVKRPAFGPATIAVAKPDAHVVIREVSKCFRGGLGQRWDNLDGADLSR